MKHQWLSIDFDEASHIDRHEEPEAFAEAMHLHSEELHRLEAREHELKEKIQAAKEHHHMLYKPWENEGTVKERVKLRELYHAVHNTCVCGWVCVGVCVGASLCFSVAVAVMMTGRRSVGRSVKRTDGRVQRVLGGVQVQSGRSRQQGPGWCWCWWLRVGGCVLVGG